MAPPIAAAPPVIPGAPVAGRPRRRVDVRRCSRAATFEAYSKEVGGERFAKFVDRYEDDAIYYFDVNVFPVHKDFIFAELYKKPRTKEADARSSTGTTARTSRTS